MSLSNFVVSAQSSTANSAVVTRKTVTASSSNVLGTNSSRRKAIVYSESGIAYLKLAPTASPEEYTVKLNGGDTFQIDEWGGQIDAISDANGATLLVTELS